MDACERSYEDAAYLQFCAKRNQSRKLKTAGWKKCFRRADETIMFLPPSL